MVGLAAKHWQIKVKLLDDQVAAGLQGDFKTGWEIAQKLEKIAPNDPRAAFNRGWYYLRQGELLDGHRLLDWGRHIDIFGNTILTRQNAGDTDIFGTEYMDGMGIFAFVNSKVPKQIKSILKKQILFHKLHLEVKDL